MTSICNFVASRNSKRFALAAFVTGDTDFVICDVFMLKSYFLRLEMTWYAQVHLLLAFSVQEES